MFDDDKTLEVLAFPDLYIALEDVTLDNILGYIDRTNGGWEKWNIGAGNNEPAVMEVIWKKYKKSKLPVHILFISDGGVTQDKEIEDIITKAARAPCSGN